MYFIGKNIKTRQANIAVINAINIPIVNHIFQKREFFVPIR
jgi:hypothetical protein